ncbi:MAG: ComEA family DNA-binding protein [Anaerolineae bacterium]|nr:ComEA family DNA-binding protein [Anaerolineae bacterium]
MGAVAQDAVDAAGGALASADLARVNLAHVLRDGDQIHVPAREEQVRLATTSPVVNLNHATVAELDTLPGVGPGLAQRIIDFREANGPFTSIEEVMEGARHRRLDVRGDEGPAYGGVSGRALSATR